MYMSKFEYVDAPSDRVPCAKQTADKFSNLNTIF